VSAYCSHCFGKQTNERRRDVRVEAKDDREVLDVEEDQQHFFVSNGHIIQLSNNRLQLLYSIYNDRGPELDEVTFLFLWCDSD